MMRKAWKAAQLCAALLLAGLALAPTSASANVVPAEVLAGRVVPPPPVMFAPAFGVGDSLFEAIRKVVNAVVDPDVIETARFSIKHPEDAAKIFARGAAQDYPFFALIGAAKVGRRLGFTQAQCLSPITAIDTVFAKAGDTIDDAQGKANTNAAMGAASGIAAEYAKQTSAQAKQELVEQLSSAIPYFGDIGTICNFAFETDLSVERNIQAAISETASSIRKIYSAFKAGDYVNGVSALISLGVNAKTACSMIDNAVGGGVIGRTPGLGAIAKGACAGFVGAVIDGVKGIINGGVGIAEAGVSALKNGVCALYSLVGSGCSSAEPPPTGLSNATAWCAGRGGIEAFLSKTNNTDDYSLICNDGSKCRAKPGLALSCATGAEIAARLAQEIELAEADFQARLPAWVGQFEARWMPQCPDETCRTGIRIVRLNATLLVTQEHEAHPERPFQLVSYYQFAKADQQAVGVVEELRYRVLPPKWAKLFEGRWGERCEDNQCRTGVKIVTANAVALVKQKAGQTPRPLYDTTAAIYAAAEGQGAALVAESKKRSADFNKATTANAGAAWEMLAVGKWGKECADAQCVAEVKKLAAQMRLAANLLQMGQPDASSLSIQGKVAVEYGPKFKAAVDASIARTAPRTIFTPIVIQPAVTPLPRPAPRPAPRPRPVGGEGGRPAPIARPAPPQPAPQPVGRPAPARPLVLHPLPVPAVTPTPAPRRIILVRPTPTPSPSPTPGGRPPPRR